MDKTRRASLSGVPTDKVETSTTVAVLVGSRDIDPKEVQHTDVPFLLEKGVQVRDIINGVASAPSYKYLTHGDMQTAFTFRIVQPRRVQQISKEPITLVFNDPDVEKTSVVEGERSDLRRVNIEELGGRGIDIAAMHTKFLGTDLVKQMS